MATAVEGGLLRSNPVAVKGAATEEHHARPVPSFEAVALLAEAIEPTFSPLVWTAATSALRYSELTGLSRSHVDLGRSSVRVERALAFVRGRGATLGPPKTPAAHRTVALPSATVDVLRAHLDELLADAHPSLVLSPATKDREIAERWLDTYAAAPVGPWSCSQRHDGAPAFPGTRRHRYRPLVPDSRTTSVRCDIRDKPAAPDRAIGLDELVSWLSPSAAPEPSLGA
jgi:hypothetical protein